jgi:hypothetical protein
MYKLIKDITGNINTVKLISDGAFIPFAPDNTDYQAFTQWLSEGNTPIPADVVV